MPYRSSCAHRRSEGLHIAATHISHSDCAGTFVIQKLRRTFERPLDGLQILRAAACAFPCSSPRQLRRYAARRARRSCCACYRTGKRSAGSLTERTADVRAIATTNHDLPAAIARKTFPEDLSRRLSRVEIVDSGFRRA
jgi:hypothetical protein